MANFQGIMKHRVYPSNRSATSTEWSYENGNPTIRFDVSGEADLYLLSNTLRLNFEFEVNDAQGALPDNDSFRTLGNAPVNILTDSKIGAMGAIQSVQISSQTNVLYEDIQHYNRLCTTLAKTNDFDDYATSIGTSIAACGNEQAQKMLCNTRQFVSTPIISGMFLEGLSIPLGPAGRGIGGMVIQINLAQPAASQFGTLPGALGSTYKIINPSISFSTAIPRGGVLPKISAQSFKALSAYYDVLNSGDQTFQINLNHSQVLSVQSNTIPTKRLANISSNSMKTSYLLNADAANPGQYKFAPIKRVTFMRGGLQFPLKYAIDEREQVNLDNAGNFITQGSGPTQLRRAFLSASKTYATAERMLANNDTERREALMYGFANTVNQAPLPDMLPQFQPHADEPIGPVLAGFGVRYDMMGAGSGASFIKQPLQVRVESGLNGVTSNSVFTFVLSSHTIVYQNGGAVVVN